MKSTILSGTYQLIALCVLCPGRLDFQIALMNADEFPPWEATLVVLTSLLEWKYPLPTVGTCCRI